MEISKIHWNEYPTFSGISLGKFSLSSAAQYTKRDIGVHITTKVVIMAERVVWTEESISSFIKVMVAEVGRGCWVDSGFKKDGCMRIVDGLHLSSDIKYTKKQCQSKYKSLKEKYTIYAVIMDNSGFGIDPRTDAPIASKSVWDAMVAAHPSAAQFRNKALPDCDSLEEIFSGEIATGVYAKSSVAVTPIPPVAVAVARDWEPDFVGEWLSGQKRERTDDTDSSSYDELAAVKKLPVVKPLPVKNSARKLKENLQAEVIGLLSTIVTNQGALVQHHTAASCLTQALNIFKEKCSASYTATERLKFQRYLKENCEIFISQYAEEQEASIQECLNNLNCNCFCLNYN